MPSQNCKSSSVKSFTTSASQHIPSSSILRSSSKALNLRRNFGENDLSLAGDKKKAISLLQEGLQFPKPTSENEVLLFNRLEKTMREWLAEWEKE